MDLHESEAEIIARVAVPWVEVTRRFEVPHRLRRRALLPHCLRALDEQRCQVGVRARHLRVLGKLGVPVTSGIIARPR